MKRHLAFALPIFAATLFPFAARSASITINPSKDNTIYAESGTLSNGGGTRFFAGENGAAAVRRGLVRFDVSGIPGTAIIDSVVLQLSVVQTHGTPVTVSLRRLLADWGEGTTVGAMGEGGGGPATAGSATWTARFSPATLWTTAGGDYVGAVSASRTVVSIGDYLWRSVGLNADIAFWLANPAQNFGWEVFGDEVNAASAKAFGSRQNATVSSRPVLTVYYTVPTAAGPAPASTRLLPVHPNPFNPTASIRYELASTQRVTLNVYDTAGRLVRTLVDGVMPSGSNETVWHGDDARGQRVASGVYLVKLSTANAAPQTQKMVLLK